MRASHVAFAAVVGASACGGNATRLHPAGSDRDDGHGLLARASARFLTGDEPDGLFDASPTKGADEGATYGGAAYGGAGYAAYVVPAWPVTVPNRTPGYHQVPHLSGAVEGVITWRGAPPRKLTTACGDIAPARTGASEALPGVLIYIEKVRIGRILTQEGKPISVGGTLVKRGCTLAPTVQIVTPLPAALAIHGDAKRARVRVTSTGEQTYELQEGGHVAVQLERGVTRVDAPDGSLAAAWIHALDTPYYALTDDRGRFRIDELAAGTYELTIWHAPAAVLVNGALTYPPPTIVKRTVKVDSARTTRLDLGLGR